METSPNLLTAKHVDDVNMAGISDAVDKCVKCAEDAFGACKLNVRASANCAVRCALADDGGVTLDQDEDMKHFRPMQRPELAGSAAEEKATKIVSDMFVGLRGALACALITRVRLMACVVSFQRTQEPT